MIKVYIASAYTNGDTSENMHKHMQFANDLIDMGFAPYAPLLNHFQAIFCPKPYEAWMNIDIEFLKTCDCVLRIPPPPESNGADHEEAVAIECGIPVFRSIHGVVEFARNRSTVNHLILNT